MEIFLKSIAGALIAAILCLVLSKNSQDMAVLVTLAACCMLMITAAGYLAPVLRFLDQLQITGKLDPELMRILLKTAGLGMLSEITAQICTDAGNAALGKGIRIGCSIVILWISLPLLSSLMELINGILGQA